MPTLPLRTPSLLLRHFVPEDAQTLRARNAEPTTRTWLPSHVYRTPAEAAGAAGFLIGQYADPADPKRRPYVLGVEHLKTGQLLGHVGFSPLDDEVEISYLIAQVWRGRGLGTQALVAACAWAAAVFGLMRILAPTASDNAASRRTLARAGFVHIGDGVSCFQGREQSVSTYVSHAQSAVGAAYVRGTASIPIRRPQRKVRPKRPRLVDGPGERRPGEQA